MLGNSLLPFVSCLVIVVMSARSEFDFFAFSQQWPPSVCIDASSEHKCVIPEEVTAWTVHGLWPNSRSGNEPSNCNSSWPFNYDDIKSLEANLTAQWPNLFTDTPKNDFWEHEWEKHGTCATSLPATDNELHFFTTALQLNTKLRLQQVLKVFDVIPSKDTGYNATEVSNLLEKYFGSAPVLRCTYQQATKRQFFLEIEICFDKSFKLMDCGSEFQATLANLTQAEECRSSEITYLYPLPSSSSTKRN
ncbi:ribonuclease Oy-like [Haliotis rubra]|uniref:ribonuclease Oy-like n=1 Tax=Haliotis rubra TaxID=36100 RepID=UPI001EE574DB|nr:ribonuclease Oy-like [Haliotis rubra]XP_046545150.1 ribonuclease Oy-like [Haliotis rubra]